MEEYFHMLMIQWRYETKTTARVSFSFLPNGGRAKTRLYGLLRGQVHIHVKSMWQTRGSGGMLPQGI